VKFDGFRVQIHKDGNDVALFSRNGNDFTHRFPVLARALARLPTKAVTLDGELAAYDETGAPNFYALMARRGEVCVWIFDILSQSCKDLRHLPLITRRTKLDQLMHRVHSPLVRYSETFSDARALLNACEQRKLEGVVSKRADAAYRSGPSRTWIKVKCESWREANKHRHELFHDAFRLPSV